jgi:hypothetical protein
MWILCLGVGIANKQQVRLLKTYLAVMGTCNVTPSRHTVLRTRTKFVPQT